MLHNALWRIFVVGNNQMYVSLQEKCPIFLSDCNQIWGTRWRSWLRLCATSREVAGSIPDGVTGIFH